MTISDRIRVKDVRVLSDSYTRLTSTTFEWRRADGEWQTQRREICDRGNGATLLPYNRRQRTVVLVKQFRYPAYVNGYDDLLIEAAAGLLDDESPENRIRLEAEEETGYRLHDVHKVFEAFTSPGLVTEKLRDLPRRELSSECHALTYFRSPAALVWIEENQALGSASPR